MTALDPGRDLRRVFAAHPTGVAALAALSDDRPVGMAASSFVPVSIDPPLVSVCVARTSTTWPTLRKAAAIGISILGAGHESVCRQLAAKNVDRFAGVAWHAATSGAVFIGESPAWFECTVEDEIAAGDHDIIVFRISDREARSDLAPLVFHGSVYRTLEAE